MVMEKYCHECGSRLTKHDNYCTECGVKAVQYKKEMFSNIRSVNFKDRLLTKKNFIILGIILLIVFGWFGFAKLDFSNGSVSGSTVKEVNYETVPNVCEGCKDDEFLLKIEGKKFVQGNEVILKNVYSGGMINIEVEGINKNISNSSNELIKGVNVSNVKTYYNPNESQSGAIVSIVKIGVEKEEYLSLSIVVADTELDEDCEAGICEYMCSALVKNIGDEDVKLIMDIGLRNDDRVYFNETKNFGLIEGGKSRTLKFSEFDDELLNINKCDMDKKSISFSK
jgi:hypothetical protein